MSCASKIVVFDLDETLGYYTEFGMFWDAITEYIKYSKLNINLNQSLFDKVLDLYPEFNRPNIINILNYLKQKKRAVHCEKIMIYTNNQGPTDWAVSIKNYFENKIKYKLFDQIIGAFKVNGKRVEICRTTHMKNYKDFIRCTKIPEDTHICFLDDTFYPGMRKNNIYYINVKPYVYDLPYEVMIDRLQNSDFLNIEDPTSMKTYMLEYMKNYNYVYVKKEPNTHNVDKILSKKILQHLHVFLDTYPNGPSKTRRIKIIKNKTLKKR
jgi:hypothetical protein